MKVEDMAFAVLDEPLAPEFVVEMVDFDEIVFFSLCSSEYLA